MDVKLIIQIIFSPWHKQIFLGITGQISFKFPLFLLADPCSLVIKALFLFYYLAWSSNALIQPHCGLENESCRLQWSLAPPSGNKPVLFRNNASFPPPQSFTEKNNCQTKSDKTLVSFAVFFSAVEPNVWMFDPSSSPTSLLWMVGVFNTGKATKVPLNNSAQYWVLGRHIAYSLSSLQCLRDGDRSWFKRMRVASQTEGVLNVSFLPLGCVLPLLLLLCLNTD